MFVLRKALLILGFLLLAPSVYAEKVYISEVSEVGTFPTLTYDFYTGEIQLLMLFHPVGDEGYHTQYQPTFNLSAERDGEELFLVITTEGGSRVRCAEIQNAQEHVQRGTRAPVAWNIKNKFCNFKSEMFSRIEDTPLPSNFVKSQTKTGIRFYFEPK